MTGRSDHWDAVYLAKPAEEVSWYQNDPRLSLELILGTDRGVDASVIDVGGGASVLADLLIGQGFDRVGVLDVSAPALDLARRRLGEEAARVEWIECDVLEYRPARPWSIWHDRAAFHFLVDPSERALYREALYRAVPPGGDVIVATFGPEGPCRCSGLETLRCNGADIARELGEGVRLIEERTDLHRTPRGVEQQFVYAWLKRVEES